MIIVSDTSPLTALLTIGEEEILQRLFGEVVIPKAVLNELLLNHSILPDWLITKAVTDEKEVRRFAILLDAGEAEAIELAKELHADRLLMDERKGRRIAIQEGIPVIGLLGVIILAKKKGLIPSVGILLGRLESEAGFYLSSDLKAEALRTIGE